jgi:ssDNA-binding replication factor A large subunit
MLGIYYISDIMSIFDELITKSEMSKEEIEAKITDFQRKHPDFNKEIASFFVAKELGIDIDDSKLVITPLNSIDENTKNINILANIVRIFPKNEYNKNDKKGTYQNAIVSDNTKELQITFWDSEIDLKQGDLVVITNLYPNMFKNEIKLNTNKLTSIKVKGNIKTNLKCTEKKIFDLEDKQYNLCVTGILKQKYDLKEFGENKKVLRAIVTDKGFNVSCVCWNSIAEELNKIPLNYKIKINNCYSKFNRGQIELHLNENTKIEIVDENPLPYIPKLKKISALDYNEVVELNVKIKSFDYNLNYICKVCNNIMVLYENVPMCANCNSNTENYLKIKGILTIDDESANTKAIITKNNLMKILNCKEEELKEKLNSFDFTNKEISVVGYLRKNKNEENEFFIFEIL